MKYILYAMILLIMFPIHSLTHLFKKQVPSFKGEKIITDPQALATIAQKSLDILSSSKYIKAHPGLLEHHEITLDDVGETLKFLAQTGKNNPKLLKSHWFYSTYFDFYRWYGDEKQQKDYIHKGWKPAPEHIRTTAYRITEISGSVKKTKKYCCGLYQLPRDERIYRPSEKKNHKDKLLRFAYSRSEIFAGALEGNTKTKPLAWVTPKDYEEIAMQGTSLIVFNKNNKILVGVEGHNGREEPERYWFVSEVEKRSKDHKLFPQAEVTCAGDMDLLGFGKVIALVGLNPQTQREEIRFQVLVDSGSAFKNNLSKLDLFAGFFKNDAEFKAHTKSYPHTARAYILIKKKSA